MLDPTLPTLLPAAISGVVQALSSFLTYRVGMKQAEQEKPGTDLPTSPHDSEREQAHVAVKAAVERYGTDDERRDLAAFERNPERYGEPLARVLADLAARQPSFAQQVIDLAQRVGGPAPPGDRVTQILTGKYLATSGTGPATLNIGNIDQHEK